MRSPGGRGHAIAEPESLTRGVIHSTLPFSMLLTSPKTTMPAQGGLRLNSNGARRRNRTTDTGIFNLVNAVFDKNRQQLTTIKSARYLILVSLIFVKYRHLFSFSVPPVPHGAASAPVGALFTIRRANTL